jgi:hypothetical protein
MSRYVNIATGENLGSYCPKSYPTNANVYAERSGKDGDRTALALAICAAALRAQMQP